MPVGPVFPTHVDSFQNTVTVDDLSLVQLSPDAEKLVFELFNQGAVPIESMGILLVNELFVQRVAGTEDCMLFLTAFGNRWALRHGAKHKKRAWLDERKAVREREIKELYAVLGFVTEE